MSDNIYTQNSSLQIQIIQNTEFTIHITNIQRMIVEDTVTGGYLQKVIHGQVDTAIRGYIHEIILTQILKKYLFHRKKVDYNLICI